MTKKSKNNEIEMPPVLSFEKKLVPSDGFMYELNWDTEEKPELLNKKPVEIREKSVKGTISNRTDSANTKKYNTDLANLQTVDCCALEENQNTLNLYFTLKILGGLDNPSSCSDKAFLEEYKNKIDSTKHRNIFYAIDELAKRYVINIANGRFLWRNRVGAEKIRIIIKQLKEGKKEEWIFDNAFEIGLDQSSFDYNDEQIKEISKKVANVLKSKYEENKSLILEVNAYCKIGLAQDVYPSEELILDKSKRGEKNKTLYHSNKLVDDSSKETIRIAAMHSQKIGNVIRTIDTWYEDVKKPISVEVYGTVANDGEAYRKNQNDFYNLFDGWMKDKRSLNDEELKYVLAMLIRGGVFSEGKKKVSNQDKNNENPSQENQDQE